MNNEINPSLPAELLEYSCLLMDDMLDPPLHEMRKIEKCTSLYTSQYCRCVLGHDSTSMNPNQPSRFFKHQARESVAQPSVFKNTHILSLHKHQQEVMVQLRFGKLALLCAPSANTFKVEVQRTGHLTTGLFFYLKRCLVIH